MYINKIVFIGVFLGLTIVSRESVANDDYRQWLLRQSAGVQAQKIAFQEYKDKRDKEFMAFLKAQWKALDIVKGMVRDEEPKPIIMPVATLLPPEDALKSVAVKPAVIIQPTEAETAIPIITPVIIELKGKRVIVDYYGKELQFYYDEKLRRRLHANINTEAVSDYWSELSQTDYEPVLKQLSAQKQAMQLNDWAFASLINRVADKINNGRRNESVLLSWFILAKSGYRARIAFNDTALFLLVPAKQEIFEVPYFTLRNQRYYAIGFDGTKQHPGQVYTYDGEYPGAINAFDMRVTSLVTLNDVSENRKLTFIFENKKYDIDVVYDRGRIEFLSTYPQLSLDLYFSSNVNRLTATPLLQQLALFMEGMSEQQAVNFLLRFVQTTLKYETDEQQFGEENYLFPEETLSYPYSDCEDRAILLSWLVRSLLKLDVVGLDYPGHVATAVSFSDVVKGDSINYNGKHYIVTDPTYINANAGMTMPDFKKYKPTVISY